MNILLSVIVWLIGIGFLVILFPVTFIIWLVSLPFDRKRKLIHWILVYQSIVLTRIIPLWKVKYEGLKRVKPDQTYVIISNHQSMLDILFLNNLKMRFKWISKIENMKVPFIGWYLRMADYITVDRGNSESKEEMLEISQRLLKEGTSIMIFPEGTRSFDGNPGLFKRGAFQLALNTNTPVLPIIIDGTGGILPKHGIIFNYGFRIRVRILDPVYPDEFGSGNVDDIAARYRELMISQLTDIRKEN